MERKTKELIFIVTYSCNLQCVYCYEPKKLVKTMSIDSARRIVKNAIDDVEDRYDGIRIQFMGGEPLMQFPLIKEVCEWLWSLNLRKPIVDISAPTNGTLLNAEMREWFASHKDRFVLGLSFDGTRMMQNKNRSSSSESIDLEFFKKTWPKQGVKMTVSPETIGFFYDGIKYLYEVGFEYVEANLAYGDYLGWNANHIRILNRELDKLVGYYIDNPAINRITLMDIPVWEILNNNFAFSACGCGRDIVCYDYNGRTYPCHIFSPITIGEDMANKACDLDFIKIEQNNKSACVNCVLRKLCLKCYGINYRDRGDCNAQSPFGCAQFKQYFYANCKLQRNLAINNGDTQKLSLINEVIKVITKSKNKTL